jgi:hypothetical protein
MTLVYAPGDEPFPHIKEAEKVLTDTLQRMQSFAFVAKQMVKPEASFYNTDETEPVFANEEFSTMMDDMEAMAEAAGLRAMAQYFGLPPEFIDPILQERLRRRFVPSQQQKKQVMVDPVRKSVD